MKNYVRLKKKITPQNNSFNVVARDALINVLEFLVGDYFSRNFFSSQYLFEHLIIFITLCDTTIQVTTNRDKLNRGQ